MVENKRIIKWISFTEWMPCSVCSTSSGDLLVILNSNSNMQTKAVRYFGSKEKQVIQLNEVGQSLFSSGYSIKYLRENRNLDILCLIVKVVPSWWSIRPGNIVLLTLVHP